MSLSGHVPGHPEVAYDDPAQSPTDQKKKDQAKAIMNIRESTTPQKVISILTRKIIQYGK